MKRIAHKKFKIRLFISVFCMFLFIIVVVSFSFFHLFLKDAKENEKINSEILVERVANQINELYMQMDVAATSITKNYTLKSVLLNSNLEKDNERVEEIIKQRTIQNVLGNIMFSSVISNAILFNSEQNYFYYTGLYLNNHEFIQIRLEEGTYGKELTEQNRSVLYLPPHQSPWTEKENIVLSVIRNFNEYERLEHTIVEVQVPYLVLNNICKQEAFGEEKAFLILDKNYTVVYPTPWSIDEFIITEEVLHKIIEQLKEKKTNIYLTEYSFTSQSILEDTFYIVLISNNKSLKASYKSYMVATVIALILTLAAVMIILYFIIIGVTKPLKELIEHIKKIGIEEEHYLEFSYDTLDEFELISDSFNQMLDKLRESIKQTYEAKIRESNANLTALQAQVNPHFLYNALNSISAASEAYGSEVTTKMCQQFSFMMRYITSQDQNRKLIEEIEHTKNYLDFMKISYDGDFNYEIELPIELYNLILPKLTIQPLTENCFKHAFSECIPPWYIHIKCYASDDKWVIEIIDNGNGFSKEAIIKLNEFKVEYEKNYTQFQYKDFNIGGLGLKNIYCRLYLFFGNTIEFDVVYKNKENRVILKGELSHD